MSYMNKIKNMLLPVMIVCVDDTFTKVLLMRRCNFFNSMSEESK